MKRLLTRAHDDFLALVAPEFSFREERSPQLSAVPRYADLVWEVENQEGVVSLLHIEMQTRANPEMGERVAESSKPYRMSSPMLRQRASKSCALGWDWRISESGTTSQLQEEGAHGASD